MDIKISGRDVKVTEDIDDFARDKLTKLDRYLPNIQNVKLDIAIQKTKRGADLAIAQITLRHGRGAILRSEVKVNISDRDSVKVAINKAVDKIYRQIRRFKDKPKSKRVRERYAASYEEVEIAEALPELIDTTEPQLEYEEPEIVRRKDVAMTPMNEEEAIQQMELLQHDFFMFYNADTQGVNVLYRREHGGYGVLVPQEANGN